jgi:hypothetical protein
MRLKPLAALLLLAPLPAWAQSTPRSIGECERLKNDLAYNQCLAMFGPAAKNVAGGYASADLSSMPAPAATPAAAMAEPIPQIDEAAETTTSGRRRYRSHRGRQYASFSTGYRHRRRR